MKTTWNFAEERQPCGTSDFRLLTPHYAYGNQLPEKVPAGTRIERVKSHPWFVIIWEPLTCKVPGPHLTMPYCCYSRTVIFYLRGYIIRPFGYLWMGNGWNWQKGGKTYEKWQQVDTSFQHEDVLEFDGERFKVCQGAVIYYQKRWWMRYSARREQPK